MGQLRWVAVGVLVLSVGSCARPAPRPAETGLMYTCCDAADVDRTYRPGETMLIHWEGIGTPSGGPIQQVELDAELTGPYATTAELKDSPSAGAGVPTIKADPIRPTGTTGDQPISLIAIPTTAAPGYYNLVTSVVGADFKIDSGHIVQVVALS